MSQNQIHFPKIANPKPNNKEIHTTTLYPSNTINQTNQPQTNNTKHNPQVTQRNQTNHVNVQIKQQNSQTPN